MSPKYARFISEHASPTRADELYAAAWDINRSASTMEQEVVTALYDAGVPLELLRLHYEGNYKARKPVMDFIRQIEGVAQTTGFQRESFQNINALPGA